MGCLQIAAQTRIGLRDILTQSEEYVWKNYAQGQKRNRNLELQFALAFNQ